MDLRATATVRSLRAALLAAVVVAAGTVAHVNAGGSLPSVPAMLTLYVSVAVVCAAFLGREASARALVALTVGGQVVVHTALSALAAHPATTAMAMADGPHGGMQHPGPSGGAVPAWLTQGIDDATAHPLMALLHVASAAAVALWLAVGERALWTLLRLARCTARGLLARALEALGGVPVVLGRPRRAVVVRTAEVLPLLPVWSRGPARRGPPVVPVPH